MQTTSSLDRASSASRACAHTRNAVRRPPSPSARALNCVTTAIVLLSRAPRAVGCRAAVCCGGSCAYRASARARCSRSSAISPARLPRGAMPRGAAADARASRLRPYRTLTPLPPACPHRPPPQLRRSPPGYACTETHLLSWITDTMLSSPGHYWMKVSP